MLRRFISLFLLAAFLLQATGSAATPNSESASAPTVGSTLVSMVASAKVLLANTLIGAIATGQMSRYQAMHDTPPDFSHLTRHPQIDMVVVRTANAQAPRAAFGTAVSAPNGMAQMRPPAATSMQPNTSSSLQVFRAASKPVVRLPQLAAGRVQGVRAMLVDTSIPATTGINQAWEYEEGAIPGAGKYMVNVANGNVVAQGQDVDIPGRGIDLAFRRTYNSQSKHDWGGADGSTIGNYGGGWTNTFDSHLGYDAVRNIISWYDIDGTRYDYSCAGTVCTAPAGQYATMTYDSGCGYWIQKKSGTAYHFWAPTFNTTITPSCFTQNPAPYGGVLGRVVTIWGRNEQNNLQFTYSWDGGDASSASHLAQILVQHSDGQSLTLTFGDVNAQRVLLSILRPDGQYVRYGYDSAIELTDVCTPGNGNTDVSPGASTICGDTVHIHHRYGYAGGYNGHQLIWADSPNFTMSWGATAPNGFVQFSYDSGNRLIAASTIGVVNYAPSDGTGIVLQSSAPTGTQLYREVSYAYGSGLTSVTDLDGHAATYTHDSLGRVTQRQTWNGSLYLVTNVTWDAQNNILTTVDPRGASTDYAYDGAGNTIATAEPLVATSAGTFRPTRLYSYDAHNNVIAYCDPVSVGAAGYDWVNRPPSDTACSSRSVAGRFTYDTSDANEPYGRLVGMTTPMGYHHAFSYSSGAQGGDFGLPTSVDGDCILQIDGTSRCPHTAYQYDSRGNPTSFDSGNGSVAYTFDTLNRPLQVTDLDGVSQYKVYNGDGTLSRTESAYQHALGMGTSYKYDDDGNLVETDAFVGGHYVTGSSPTLNTTPSITRKFYDADDRLVEVEAPSDATYDVFDKPWITRYIYDLSAGGTTLFNNQVALKAYGNLVKTQELLPASSGALTATVGAAGSLHPNAFKDLKGFASDPIDRTTQKYFFSVDTAGVDLLEHDSDQYDDPSAVGRLHSHCNAASQCSTNTYDALGQITSIAYSDPNTPPRSMTYDPNGRTVSAAGQYGTQTYTLDADGRVTTSVEPQGSYNGWSGATLSYHYYADGMQSSIDVSSSSLNQVGLFTYSYRRDGDVQAQQINLPTNPLVGQTNLAFAYTPGGRLQSRAETGTGANSTPETISYSPYGQLAQTVYPAGSFSNMEYDASGSLLGELPSTSTRPSVNSYTTRSEAATVAPSPGGGGSVSYYANGTALTIGSASSGVTTSNWAPRMGVALGSSNVNGSVTAQTQFGFDAAGRNTTATSLTDNPNGGPNGDGTSSSFSLSRTYDAENELIAQTGDSGSQSYRWGATGHPLQIGSSTTGTPTAFENLHWDGDQLLFTTNASGQVDDIKVGSTGDITPLDPGFAGLTFYDRGPGDTVGFCHNATGAVGSGALDPYERSTKFGQLRSSPCTRYGGQAVASMPTNIEWWSDGLSFGGSAVGRGMTIGMPRTDGIADGLNTIQGGRTYDPQLGGWTTPDAYAGTVTDPMSQKSYVWNGNNAISLSDPTGFDCLGYDPVPSWLVPSPRNNPYMGITYSNPYTQANNRELANFLIGVVTGKIVGDTIKDVAIGMLRASLEKAMETALGTDDGRLKPGFYVENLCMHPKDTTFGLMYITISVWIPPDHAAMPAFDAYTYTYADGHTVTVIHYDPKSGKKDETITTESTMQANSENGEDPGSEGMEVSSGVTIVGGYDQNHKW